MVQGEGLAANVLQMSAPFLSACCCSSSLEQRNEEQARNKELEKELSDLTPPTLTGTRGEIGRLGTSQFFEHAKFSVKSINEAEARAEKAICFSSSAMRALSAASEASFRASRTSIRSR